MLAVFAHTGGPNLTNQALASAVSPQVGLVHTIDPKRMANELLVMCEPSGCSSMAMTIN